MIFNVGFNVKEIVDFRDDSLFIDAGCRNATAYAASFFYKNDVAYFHDHQPRMNDSGRGWLTTLHDAKNPPPKSVPIGLCTFTATHGRL